MSTWITIKDQEDVDFDPAIEADESTLDVCIGDDNFGNNYVSIPLRFIVRVLKDYGYNVESTTF